MKYKTRLNIKKTLGPTGLYELVLVAVHIENFRCTAYMPGTCTSTALSGVGDKLKVGDKYCEE